MTLPLMERAAGRDAAFALTEVGRSLRAPFSAPSSLATRMPSRAPGPGEQYRFHVDMGACIGCKCCVVACNEQNGNPASINWRRVGELEGGWYPRTHRAYLSMSCNHCLNPTCMSGCPVDAYTKDAATGIVLHSAEACIGCQYCTWNCSYGVPQYNPERGVVGKCDMCYGRLELGQSPACVSACPSGAIQVEIVNIAEWRVSLDAAAPATGLPLLDHSASTTRLTLRADVPPDMRPVDLVRVEPAEPHWPLIVMTVLTQLSVGGFVAIWGLQLFGATERLGIASLMSLVAGGLALAASTLHLGRPIYAYRALKMWRRSWLSREVLCFTAFAGVASVHAGVLWSGLPYGAAVGALTVAIGLAGVASSACIYRVPSRPAWDTPWTLVQFLLTAAILGPLFAATLGSGAADWLAFAAAVGASVGLAVLALRFFHLSASDRVERQASARLLATTFSTPLLLRGALLVLGAIVLPLMSRAPAVLASALVLALGGELLGRYLFFVSVVPKHMTAPYLGSEAA